MAYDAAKAHDYYVNYTKRGLKKGRKKGTKKKTSSKRRASAKVISLVGISSAGLNEEGSMRAALLKEQIKDEMNAAVAQATTPEQKAAIREQYQYKAYNAVQKLKADPKYAKASGSKSGGKSSGGSSSGSSGSSKSGTTKDYSAEKRNAAIEAATRETEAEIEKLRQKLSKLSPEEKADFKFKVQDIINQIQQTYGALARKKNQIREKYK